MDELLKYIKALVYLHASAVAGGDEPPRTEVLLARAGLKHAEIANILGKTPAAVAKAVSRAK